MKTFIIESQTNYDLMVHIVNAETKEEAMKIALNSGAWPGCEIFEIDTEREGLVHSA